MDPTLWVIQSIIPSVTSHLYNWKSLKACDLLPSRWAQCEEGRMNNWLQSLSNKEGIWNLGQLLVHDTYWRLLAGNCTSPRGACWLVRHTVSTQVLRKYYHGSFYFKYHTSIFLASGKIIHAHYPQANSTLGRLPFQNPLEYLTKGCYQWPML